MISNDTVTVLGGQEGVVAAGIGAGGGGRMHGGPPEIGGVGGGKARVVRVMAEAVVAAVEEGDLEAARAVAGVMVEVLGRLE